jgi:hypothetical protein
LTTRFYSSISQQTTLTSSISGATTVINVAATTGFPSSTPFTLALDYSAPNEELVEVTLIAGTSLTVTRAIDGTSATVHNAGALVRHVSSARDFADSRFHENSTTGIHGLAGGSAIVGTNDVQTLSNKTFIDATGTLNRILIKNGPTGGAWTTTVQGDAAQPSADLQNWKPDVASNTVALVANDGNIKVINRSTTQDSSITDYRLRVTEFDGTTDVFSVRSSGAVNTKLSNSSNGYTVIPENDSAVSTARAFTIRNSADSAVRSAWFTHGGLSLVGTAPSVPQLYVQAPATMTTDIMQVKDSTPTTLFAVGSAGKTFMEKGARVIGDSAAAAVVLELKAGSASSGSVTNWEDETGALVGSFSRTGLMTARDLFLTNAVWTAYTPVLTAATTNPTVGNGSIIGRFYTIGKTVLFAMEFVFGSTSTAGSGAWSFSLPPLHNVTNASGTPVFVASANGSVAGNRFHADGTLAPTASTFQLFAPTATGNCALTNVSQTVMGGAWANGNFIRITGMYESDTS